MTLNQEWSTKLQETLDELLNFPLWKLLLEDDLEGFVLLGFVLKLKTTDTGLNTGFNIESNDAAALGYIGWAIERHLDEVPSKVRPIFQKFWKIQELKKKP
jgi:hypothetical protein